eukprot:TRINITY_DN19136_c0_g1_i1.p1 TRINITY_DN19136_c0_g1~~TRINITY_DN19136_c0_g1_i1.p1  ORF type:complete len:128 (-),score=45.86 TRINITY_DN19136_c0_g1_i1:59-442(-)
MCIRDSINAEYMGEMQIEEMRKSMSQMEGRALFIPRMNRPKVRLYKKEVWLLLNTSSVAITSLSCKMIHKVDKNAVDYVVYYKDMKAEEVVGKVLFTDEEEVVREIGEKAKAVVVSCLLYTSPSPRD